MSQSYYVNRDKRSWKYKNTSYPYSSWNFFTDHETDLPSIKKFFSQSSDSVNLSFVDDDLRPANFFEISRGNNRIDVTLNGGEKKFTMFDHNFIPEKQQEQYFHDRSTEEIITKADGYSGQTKIKFYKDNADDHTLTEYNLMVKERMTDDAVREKLSTYDPDRKSEVFFPEDNPFPKING